MATRPATGSLKMPVTTVRPFQTTALGSPTLTDTTCSSDDGCIRLLLLIPQSLLHLGTRGAVRRFQGGVPAKTQRLSFLDNWRECLSSLRCALGQALSAAKGLASWADPSLRF